ncbi:MAG: serine hydrolase domain-containing protein [Chloroflexota bacterium]
MNFSDIASPQSVGMNADTLTDIQRIVTAQVADGLTLGTQLVVARHGQVVLDLALGTARREPATPVTHGTLFYSWSVVKPLTALCVYHLIECGQLALDDPLVKVWPEFGAHGKDGVTVRHVLSHRAGFPITPPTLKWYQYAEWETVMRALEETELTFAPGSAAQYHALTFGWALGEVVRRVDGRAIDAFMRDEIFAPLQMRDSYLKLPEAELGRAVELVAPESFNDGYQATRAWNLPLMRQAVIPAAGLHSTARDLARFYQAMLNGGELDGARVCAAESITQARAPSYTAGERERESNVPAHFGHGFHLGGYAESSWGGARSTARTFGHNGWATNAGWADPDLDVLCVFLNNGMLPDEANHQRLRAVCDLVWEACAG